jgi:outer membrane protein
VLLLSGSAALAQNNAQTLDVAQMFELAAARQVANEAETAVVLYQALEANPDPEIRAEARFRHGQLLETQHRYKDAALLYRAILDEKPDAQRVRLELAKVYALMGDMPGARRALRQAQAGGLPPEVAQVVDQYAAALRSFKPVSMSLEVSLAPSTNVNRATSAKTLDTIIAPFDLSDDARAKSGLGFRIGGQVFARVPLKPKLQLTARISGQSNLYRDSQFDDAVTAAQIGAELQLGKVQLRPQIGRSYRWYGHSLYATTNSVSINFSRPIGRRAQLEVQGGAGWADYRTNDLQDGQIYDASISYERALTQRSGGSFTLSGQRQVAADRGYSTTSGGANLVVWREMGKATVFANAGLYRLEGDARLFLFPDRRKEWLGRAGIGATFRQIKIAGFSPVVRLNYERNQSTVGIYDYSSLSGDIGITRAF